MLWLQEKYFNFISNRFERLTPVRSRPFQVNFRCIFCGDSKKKQHKKRAYVLERDNNLSYYCHNCGIYLPFDDLLKNISPSLYNQYILERLKSRGIKPKRKTEDPIFDSATPVFKKKKVKFEPPLDKQDSSHPCVVYAKKRQIPQKFWSSIHPCEHVSDITSQLKDFEHLMFYQPAIVLPYYDKENDYSHISFRAIDKSTNWRYYTLGIDSTRPKVWGLKHVDWNQPVYVFEGPIDAMCYPNSIALGGSVGTQAIEYFNKHINTNTSLCFVYDNELSNRDILRQINKRIDEGYNVVLFSNDFHWKDINEAIVYGKISKSELVRYIQLRTFSGLKAKLELAKLRKPKYR
jgi:transcription elongation factor Elf1